MFNLTPLVRSLLILNVVMFVLPELILPWLLSGMGHAENTSLFIEFFGLRYIFSPLFQATQLLSYSLVHASWGHLFSNMLGLFVFGPLLEQSLGSKRFLLYYFGTAIGAGLIYSGIHYAEVAPFLEQTRAFLEKPDPDLFASILDAYDKRLLTENLGFVNEFGRHPTDPEFVKESGRLVRKLAEARMSGPMVGASGAVFGVMLGFGYLFPNLQMMLLFPPIPVKAKYLVGFYGIYALYSAIEKVPGDNVAHYAHLGGMVVGFLLLKAWRIRPYY